MDYAIARRNMVENQIRTNYVSDTRLISAMEEIPREAFLPKAAMDLAYMDEAAPVGSGRYLPEPLVLARLLQAAEVHAGDVVLDIGCATGYAAAVLSRLANTVVALESDPELAATATSTLAKQHFDTVAVVEGDLEAGYPKQAPYDVIFFGGAIAAIPDGILDQLGEGGRLVAVVHDTIGVIHVGKGILVRRRDGRLFESHLFDLGAPFLPGFEPRPVFTL